MVTQPAHAAQIRTIVEDRLQTVLSTPGVQESVSVEWRGRQLALPVIAMPVNLLSYNPATHRIRAQRSLDTQKNQALDADPYGQTAQAYLHQLLMGDPADPSKVDPTFEALKEDLREHGQNDPGVITRDGVLINGNTRRAALKELSIEHIRVGVLPEDAGLDDILSVELALQLRRDHRRDYSFMNLLLAIDERIRAGRSATEIQRDFRMKPATMERNRWILQTVQEAISRSQVELTDGSSVGLRLVDFEEHQGKLEELHRAYTSLKARSPEEAECLREQRLLAITLGKSKTDVRWIEWDFADKFMPELKVPPADPDTNPQPPARRTIPGTKISRPEQPRNASILEAKTTEILKARSVELAATKASPVELEQAQATVGALNEHLNRALDRAGRSGRVLKRKFAVAERLADATEDLQLCLTAIAEARATNSLNPEDFDDALLKLKDTLLRVTQVALRGGAAETPGARWLAKLAKIELDPELG